MNWEKLFRKMLKDEKAKKTVCMSIEDLIIEKAYNSWWKIRNRINK